MAVETTHDYPPNGMVGILAYERTSKKWVVIACSDVGVLSVAVASLPLPSGAATATKQDTLNDNVPHAGTAPTVYNKTMTSADTEYSQALPANVKKFMIKCRGEYDIKVCFTAEASGTTYVTVPSGQCYWEDGVRKSSLTIYFQCATAAQVAEIVAWA